MFRIPNLLTFPLILSGVLYHTVLSEAIGFTASVCGILAGTLPYLWLYLKGGMGAGDLKLLAGVGAWLGPWLTLHVLIVSGLATGCYSLGILLLNAGHVVRPAPEAYQPDTTDKNRLLELEGHHPSTELAVVLSRKDRRYHAVPFGAMIALGVIVVVFWIA